MKPIVMIALEFAPVQTPGAFRSIELAKYLPQFGYQPHVITIDPDDGAQLFGARRNDALLANLPDAVKIHYIKPARPPRPETRIGQFLRIWTALNDGFYARFETALRAKLIDIGRDHAIEAVYVSAPPFGAARLGELAADTLGTGWALDMRDAWSEWGMAPYPSYLHYRARLADEARAFKRATAVVTVTERLREVFRETHPGVPAGKFEVVANGFDGPAFEAESMPSPPASGPVNIVYAGSFYYTPPKPAGLRHPHRWLQYTRGDEDWSYRSPLYFFRAWQALARTNPTAAGRIRFHHIGATPPWLETMAADHGLADQCKWWGMLPKQELTTALQTMDIQLATSMKRERGGDYCLASKTFDYLLARKPILAFVTDGSQQDFLRASGAAIICDPDDAEHSAATMLSAISDGVDLELDADYLNGHHRREAAVQMAKVLGRVITATAGTGATT